MTIASIITHLESIASPALQESYDNSGLLSGNAEWECQGLVCALDVTRAVIDEAIRNNCNLVVAHHPAIFGGLKTLSGNSETTMALVMAIKHDVAIYAIHTNLDNVLHGVNGRIADQLSMVNRKVLQPKFGIVKKLFTFVPTHALEQVRAALFNAGGGTIGNYDECSFGTAGTGTFRAGTDTNPFVGEHGIRHYEEETKLEVIFPAHLQSTMIAALLKEHPYEEVAFDVVDLQNAHPAHGSGLIGDLPQAMTATEFLQFLRDRLRAPVIRHSQLHNAPLKKIAVCGGAGSFLITNALAQGADAFVTSDIKYHEFFNTTPRMILCDVGHFESEQFTRDLLAAVLRQKFPNFAILKSDVNTNPVYYYI